MPLVTVAVSGGAMPLMDDKNGTCISGRWAMKQCSATSKSAVIRTDYEIITSRLFRFKDATVGLTGEAERMGVVGIAIGASIVRMAASGAVIISLAHYYMQAKRLFPLPYQGFLHLLAVSPPAPSLTPLPANLLFGTV